jgi:hypothetical protein
MGYWKRILIVTCCLVGGAGCFYYWSLGQFNQAFSQLDVAYNSSALVVAPEIAPIVTDTATSTASTTMAVSTSPVGIISDIFFTFPVRGKTVYSGCTYDVAWTASSTVNSIDLSLVDAGTQKSLGPVTSGITAHIADKRITGMQWKVGTVWPGNYYIGISQLNGTEVKMRSPKFIIEAIPDDVDVAQRADYCSQTGGKFQ